MHMRDQLTNKVRHAHSDHEQAQKELDAMEDPIVAQKKIYPAKKAWLEAEKSVVDTAKVAEELVQQREKVVEETNEAKAKASEFAKNAEDQASTYSETLKLKEDASTAMENMQKEKSDLEKLEKDSLAKALNDVEVEVARQRAAEQALQKASKMKELADGTLMEAETEQLKNEHDELEAK